jgi:isopenicillin N synthase-like dioxygenase
MTQVLSNGRYQAPVHRVLTNSSQSRFSLPFFLQPKYSCVIQPIIFKQQDDAMAMYRPILWSEFRRGRVLGDYADLGEEVQISHYLIE